VKPTQQQLLRNLQDAGCTDQMIQQYFRLREAGRTKEQICLLFRHRAALLDRLHQDQKQIDCLDYLIFQIREGRQNPPEK